MADAIGREYKILPTDLLGMNLSPASRIILNARILAHRNEQAKISSIAESQDNSVMHAEGVSRGPTLQDKIRAKRMRMESDRLKALKMAQVE